MSRLVGLAVVGALAGCGGAAVQSDHARAPEDRAGLALRELRAVGAGLGVRPGECALWDRVEALAAVAVDPRVQLVVEGEAADRPGDPAVAYLLGFIYARQHRPAAARERLEAARAASGDAACVLDQLSALAELEGRYEEALAWSRSATLADPGRGRSWLLLGTAEFRLGRAASARVAIERSVALDPSPEGFGNLTAVLQALGETSAAATVCEEAARRFPEHPSILFNLAVLRGQQDRLAEAESLYGRVLAAAPGHLTARYNLGLILAAGRRFADAEAAFRAVLEADPAHAAARVNLGSVLIELGRPAEGEAAYREALVRDPGNAEAYFNLAVLAHRRGEWRDAAGLARACLDRNPDHAGARALLHDADEKLRTAAPKG